MRSLTVAESTGYSRFGKLQNSQGPELFFKAFKLAEDTSSWFGDNGRWLMALLSLATNIEETWNWGTQKNITQAKNKSEELHL